LAAEQGHVRAQYFVGGFYEEGMGVTKDDAQAVRWL
jgi:TPR repeat protein